MGTATHKWTWRSCPALVPAIDTSFCSPARFHQLWMLAQKQQDPTAIAELANLYAGFWTWLLTTPSEFRSQSILYVPLLRRLATDPDSAQAQIDAWVAGHGLEDLHQILVEGMLLMLSRLRIWPRIGHLQLEWIVGYNFRLWLKDRIFVHARSARLFAPAVERANQPIPIYGNDEANFDVGLALCSFTGQDLYILYRHLTDQPFILPNEKLHRSQVCQLLEAKLSNK